MARHPEGTEKLIDTREERRKAQEERILRDEKIMRSIRRDQRQKKEDEEPHSTPHRNVA